MFLCVHLGKYFAYLICRKVFNLGQFFVWFISGTYFTLLRSRKEENYHWSAHLQDVVFRYKLDYLAEPAGPRNFITTHCAFVSPSYVLQDNVTLYSITPSEAVFIECNEGVDVTHSKYGSFLRNSQFENARRTLTMPIAAFNKIADQVGEPQGEIIFLSNTSRCGSTLMCQMFEETGCCVSFSESDILNTLGAWKGSMAQDQLDVFVRNCIRMQCKYITNRKISAYIMKLSAPTMEAVPMFMRSYPRSKQLFMYRDGLKVAQSLVRISSQAPLFWLIMHSSHFHPLITKFLFGLMGFPAGDFNVKVPSALSFGAVVWATAMQRYLHFRKQGVDIHAIRYDDIVQQPLEATKAIFHHSNLPEELAESAVKALETDSQINSSLSRKNTAAGKVPKLDGKDKIFLDGLCDQFGVPRVNEQCILEGTITSLKDQ